MNRKKYWIHYVIVLALFNFHIAHAATMPAYSGKMNNAIGSILQSKAVKLGLRLMIHDLQRLLQLWELEQPMLLSQLLLVL